MYADPFNCDPFRGGCCHLSGVPGGEKASTYPASDNSRRADTAVPWLVLTIGTSKMSVMNIVNGGKEDVIRMVVYDSFRLKQELLNS